MDRRLDIRQDFSTSGQSPLIISSVSPQPHLILSYSRAGQDIWRKISLCDKSSVMLPVRTQLNSHQAALKVEPVYEEGSNGHLGARAQVPDAYTSLSGTLPVRATCALVRPPAYS